MRVPDRNSPGRPGLRSEPSLRARAAVALSGLFVMTAAVASPAAAQGVFFPETFTLSNGMEVVAVVNRRVPVVAHMVMYKVGSADEPRGRSGIAHYLEHLMFKGTDTVEPGAFSKEVSRHGGRDNAFTSYDYTGYFQTVAADRLEMVMRLEADRMANLRLTDALARPELQVVREERKQRTDNSPQARLGEQVVVKTVCRHAVKANDPLAGRELENLVEDLRRCALKSLRQLVLKLFERFRVAAVGRFAPQGGECGTTLLHTALDEGVQLFEPLLRATLSVLLLL
jgi:predicted Zn-dependent peptidase